MSSQSQSENLPALRIGLVGLSTSGGWASLAHLPAIAAVEGLSVTALATSTDDSARAAAEAFDVPHAFSNVADLAHCEEVDLVVVAVKVPLHRELLLPALTAGKPVLSEWPLARSVDEADELIAGAGAGAGAARTFVGLQARASSALRYLRDLVDDGYVGTVLSTSLIASGHPWGLPITTRTEYILDPAHGATLLTIPFGHTLDGMSMVLGDVTDLLATTATRRATLLNKETGVQVPMTAPDQLAVTGRIGDGAVLSAHYRGGVSRGTNFLWEINGTDGDLQVSAESGSLQLGPIKIMGARGAERDLVELHVPASYDRYPNLAGSPAHNVAHAYHQILRDLRDNTSEVPDFSHARVLHRQLDAIKRWSPPGANNEQLGMFRATEGRRKDVPSHS